MDTLKVEARNEMSPAFEKLLAPTPRFPSEPPAGEANSKLNVAVIFTSIESTLSALRKAGLLASRLRACITLIVPQIVPYPLPLTSPPMLLDFTERRFRVIANESPVETTVQIYLCRDRLETLLGALRPHSVVVIGGGRSWWPTPEKRLARQLRRAGHDVVLAEA
jgi:hypothetical protein